VKLRDIENQASLLQTLVALHRHEKLAVRELIGEVESSSPTVLRTIDKLLYMGLIAESRMSSFPFKRELHLTRMGERIAEKLADVSEILEKE
jgi:DNA-binding MarR family transcriptional regulator